MFKARIFTLYPELFPGPFNEGLFGKALKEKIWELEKVNIRDYATDLIYYQQAKSLSIGSPTFMKEVDKEIARAVVDDNEKLNQIFEEIDSASEVGQFTQDETEQEDQEVEQEEI